jgi:hypothetical protein
MITRKRVNDLLNTILSFLGISYSKNENSVPEMNHHYNEKEIEVAELLKERRMLEVKEEDDIRMN